MRFIPAFLVALALVASGSGFADDGQADLPRSTASVAEPASHDPAEDAGAAGDAKDNSNSALVRPLVAKPVIQPTGQQAGDRTDWTALMNRSWRFLAMQHAFRFATEPGTRAELKGRFWQDYVSSLKGLHGWGDTDPFIVNYIGHSMMGSVTNYMYVHASPRQSRLQFGRSGDYWRSRMKAMAFTAVYSTQFELGPLSEASLGNVGMDRKTMGYVDLVMTPVLGTGWMVGEDAIDALLITRLERLSTNGAYRMLVRSFLNPSRCFANALRWKVPWARDDRGGIWRK